MAGRKTRVPVVVVGKAWDSDDLRIEVPAPTVQVGKAWTEDEIRLPERDRAQRTRIAVWLSAFFAGLTAVFTVYAMVNRDTVLVHSIFSYVGNGLLGAGALACGDRWVQRLSNPRRVRQRRASKRTDK